MEAPSSLCTVCDAVATFRCSKCGFARYCGRECQEKDWARHKVSCDAALESTAFSVDGNCRHGGPPNADLHDVFRKVLSYGAAIEAHGRTVQAQLLATKELAEAMESRAEIERTQRVLTAMAVDAFGDGNMIDSRGLLQLVVFLECYSAGGPPVLDVLFAPPAIAQANPHMLRFLRAKDSIGARAKHVRELQKRIPCSCMVPLPNPAAKAS